MSGWEQAQRRYRLVHDVAQDVADDGSKALPRWWPAIEAEFGGIGGFLRDIQRRYITAVEARLDAVLEAHPVDPRAPVDAVLAEVAQIYPGLHRLLAEHKDHPALTEGDARFERAVLTALGASLDGPPPTIPRLADPIPTRTKRTRTKRARKESPTKSPPAGPVGSHSMSSQSSGTPRDDEGIRHDSKPPTLRPLCAWLYRRSVSAVRHAAR